MLACARPLIERVVERIHSQLSAEFQKLRTMKAARPMRLPTS